MMYRVIARHEAISLESLFIDCFVPRNDGNKYFLELK